MARVRLLLVAIVVFGTFLVLVSPPGNRGALANLKSHRYTALWPEQTWRDGLSVQLASDNGDPSVSWRTRADLVGLRFARQVLGWRRPDVEVLSRGAWDDGTENARVSLVDRGEGHGPGTPAEHWLWLQRLFRSGPSGIWSVMNVESHRLHTSTIWWVPGNRVRAGIYLDAFTMGLPEGVPVIAGSFFRGPCGLVTDSARVHFWRGETRFQAARHGRGGGDCAPERPGGAKRTPLFEPSPGAIVVARPPGPDVEDLPGLFDSRSGPGKPILDLTAYAVEFQPRKGPLPPPVPRWWSIEPRLLPVCPDHRIRLGKPGFEAHPQGGMGLGVGVHVEGRACRLRETFELEVRTQEGSPGSVTPNPARVTVRGDLPRDYLGAGWVLGGWCSTEGPVFTMSGAGQQITFSGMDERFNVDGPDEVSECSSHGPSMIYPWPSSS